MVEQQFDRPDHGPDHGRERRSNQWMGAVLQCASHGRHLLPLESGARFRRHHDRRSCYVCDHRVVTSGRHAPAVSLPAIWSGLGSRCMDGMKAVGAARHVSLAGLPPAPGAAARLSSKFAGRPSKWPPAACRHDGDAHEVYVRIKLGDATLRSPELLERAAFWAFDSSRSGSRCISGTQALITLWPRKCTIKLTEKSCYC
jgi:hypothetical protein